MVRDDRRIAKVNRQRLVGTRARVRCSVSVTHGTTPCASDTHSRIRGSTRPTLTILNIHAPPASRVATSFAQRPFLSTRSQLSDSAVTALTNASREIFSWLFCNSSLCFSSASTSAAAATLPLPPRDDGFEPMSWMVHITLKLRSSCLVHPLSITISGYFSLFANTGAPAVVYKR